MKRWIRLANFYAARAGYGKGFWILMTGVVLFSFFLVGMELTHPQTVVERIPASDQSISSATTPRNN